MVGMITAAAAVDDIVLGDGAKVLH